MREPRVRIGELRQERSGGILSCEDLAQFAAEDFAGGGAGDGVDEVDFARLLVVGEAVGDEAA